MRPRRRLNSHFTSTTALYSATPESEEEKHVPLITIHVHMMSKGLTGDGISLWNGCRSGHLGHEGKMRGVARCARQARK